MKIATSLEKRLSTYSLAAAAVFTGVPQANASITLINVNHNLNNEMTYGISFDGSTQFYLGHLGSSGSTAFSSLPNGVVMIQEQTTSAFWLRSPGNLGPKALDSLYTISESRLFTKGVSNWNMVMYTYNYIWSIVGSSFQNSTKYMGIKFELDDGTHYGWVKVTCGNYLYNGITINSWAYETTPDLAILAGSETSLPVELFSFTAGNKYNSIELNWITESEKDNVGFILERRLAGELDWDKIATFDTDARLRGNGTTSEKHSYSFTDSNVNSGETYEYRLSDVDINGTVEIKKTVAITVEATPTNFTLNQNYPNPFNPSTTIEFALTETENVNLSIYNMAGQLVETLIDGELNAGNHSTEWNAANVPAGTYFYQLQAGSHKEIKKAVLVK